MLIIFMVFISNLLLMVVTFITLFSMTKDYLKDRTKNKSIHKEFKIIQITYMILCVILLMLQLILTDRFYNMLILKI
jgi:hypothetical protein